MNKILNIRNNTHNFILICKYLKLITCYRAIKLAYIVQLKQKMVCHKKGEKVSTPLDKDGRGLHDLYDTYGQVPLTLRDSYIF